MLKLSFSRTRFDSNYSNCTGRSIENISCSSGGAQEKGKTRWNSITTKINFEHSPHWMLISSSSGFWCCLSLTLRISLIRSKKWRIGHWAVGKSVSVWMHRRLPCTTWLGGFSAKCKVEIAMVSFTLQINILVTEWLWTSVVFFWVTFLKPRQLVLFCHSF